MKLLLDAHYIGSHAGGNETYTRNLINGLRDVAPAHEITLLTNRGHEHDATLRGFPARPLAMHSAYVRVPLLIPLAALRTHADLLHIQYTAPPWCPCPYVVTMHDLVAFKLPQTMPFRERHRLRLLSGNTLRRAARIFTVTHAMRREISEHFQIDPARIDVTPNALDPIYTPVEDEAARAAARAKYALPERYVLFVGLLQPRKNLARLARAFAKLVAEGLPHSLVITGKRAWLYGDMLEEMQSLNIASRLHYTDYVDRDDLPALYSMADCFAFPSLYEGFGIPVIEALACGTPVVASSDPALVEVSGGAALCPDPHDVDAIAAALRCALTDTAWRATARAQGLAHIQQYTAQNLGLAALGGYERALRG
jgi:glycosyltransferase involved in cell wall biosynthesis